MEQSYHVGLVRGTGPCKCWANGHRKTTVVLQLCRNIDYLSCDLWQYLGQWCLTKRYAREHKTDILARVNRDYDTAFIHILID